MGVSFSQRSSQDAKIKGHPFTMTMKYFHTFLVNIPVVPMPNLIHLDKFSFMQVKESESALFIGMSEVNKGLTFEQL